MVRSLYFFIPAAAGALVGCIYYRVTETVPLSVVFGLLTAVVFFVLSETRRICSKLEQKVGEWELKVLDLQHLMKYLEHPNPYVKEQVQTVLSELRNLAKTATQGEVILKAHSVQRDCIHILRQVTSEDVFATSYVNPKFFWCTPEGDLYRQQCFDLVQKGIKVTRVFIEPARCDNEEKQCIEDEMKKQKSNGVQVKRVSESSLPEDCRIDFLLIPGKFVAYLGVGARGDVLQELKVCFGTQELNKAKQLAEEIEKLSTDVFGKYKGTH